MKTSALAVAVASLALAPVAMAADSAAPAGTQATFQTIPAVSTAQSSESVHDTTPTSTTGTTRYYYYPTYRYQPTSGAVTTGNTNFVLPSTNTTTITAPTLVSPTVAAPRFVTPRRMTTINDALSGYLTARLSYGRPNDVDLEFTTPSEEMKYTENFGFSLAAGVNLIEAPTARTRLELEGSYRQTEADRFGATDLNDDGRLKIYSGMANLYQDFAFGRIRPFIGGGVGVSYVDFDDVFGNNFPGDVIDDEETALALQGMIGIEFEMADNLSLMLEGRRFGIYNLEYETLSGLSDKADFINDEVSLGVKVSF